MGRLERKTVSKVFALFIIALLLLCLDMCGYPFYSEQKNPFTRYKMVNDRNEKFAEYKKRKQNQS